ncbi:protein serine/threonine phosphatase [Tieghemostelium lacteum]|uniref:protein-serine/threonine phosphatase n=1 Tax=Tieghemostelium lacteum TaxID=361077 RepID=A0A151ZRU6_TIELA|nr:protein serine/threonine phosphatase [Tieghemostelium lacteum]|eukprot:KYQ96655.1 protein serine/threonine phosphatase [Tieghemostelium lacteum]
MEDTHAIYDDLLETLNYQGREEIGQCSYYAVYDGHGGTETSKALEPIVHKCIVESPSFKSGQYEQSLREGFEQADKMVIPICGKSGSTGVSCMLVGNQLYCANIGDSEAVLARNTISSSGKPPVYESHLLTYKHLANDDKEKQRITELGGMIIFGRLFGSLAVSRSFGDREYKEGEKKFVTCEPFQQTIELTPKDHFLILACDGLWDQVSYDEAVQMVAKLLKLGKSPQEISQALAQDSWEKGSVDNITVLVIVLNWK